MKATRRVHIEMRVAYDREFPADWDDENIAFNLNDGSSCANNALRDIKATIAEGHCLCNRAKFHVISDEEWNHGCPTWMVE